MRLEPLLTPDLTLIITGCTTRDAAFQIAAAHLAPALPHVEADQVLKGLAERERVYPTATPEGVAFPHALLPGLEQTVVMPCRLNPAIVWGGKVAQPQELMFLMVGSDDRPWEHVRLLARLARIVKTPGAHQRLCEATDAADLHALLVREDRAHV